MILESQIVTASLDHDEAEMLPNWALAQVELCALSSKDMGDEGAEEHIGEGMDKVRRLMEMVSDLVEEKEDLSRMDMVKGLTHLLCLAMVGPISKADYRVDERG